MFTGYVIICILYIAIRAAKSIQNISAPGYGVLVLVMEALGMVSLLQAGINHLYKVWSSEHQQTCSFTAAVVHQLLHAWRRSPGRWKTQDT